MTRHLRRCPLFGLLAILAFAATHAAAQSTQGDPAYQALIGGNVFVDPSLHGLDEARLQAAAEQANDTPHTITKIAVWSALPDGWSNLQAYTDNLAQELNIGKNALIVIVAHGPGAGIWIDTGAKLSAADKEALIAQARPEIMRDETGGIADLAGKTAGKINMNEYGNSSILWLIFLVVVLVVGGLLFSASRKRKKEMAAMREPVNALRENVLKGIEYLDGYIDVLPKNNPDSDQVRISRQAASAKFEQAAKIIDRATEPSDLQRAQGLLDRAQADVATARRYLDRATGGTGSIPGDDALRPEPLPDSQREVSAIPAKLRGVSFFSSRPAPLGSLVPVTITVNGQSRQVLVTPEEADELRQGRMPWVRAFQVGGRYVPWYEYQGYDPYRDYWAYENAGWGGFGGGLAAGFIGAELLDSLMAPAYMPYAYATDNMYYQGYADSLYSPGGFGGGDYGYGGGMPGFGDQNYNDPGVNASGNDFNNADFGGGGNDFNNADFGGGGNDFNNADFGGGGNDFNNADFGGGGNDFDNTDFGGGGNDFSGGDF